MPSPAEQTSGPTAKQRKHSLLRLVFAALGFTTIFFLWLVQPGVEPSWNVFYHWSGDPKSLFMAIAIDMIGAWLMLTLLLLIGQRPGRTRVAVWVGLLLFTPWMVYLNWRLLRDLNPYHRYSACFFFGALIATALITACWRPQFARHLERAIASATTILVFAGVFGVLLLCRLAWFGWKEGSINGGATLHHRQASEKIQPHRIIWIVFDELSYQQVYEHRFPGLRLPAFDALAAQSTLFTNVAPLGYYTERVLPGLLSGRAYKDIQNLPSGQISVQDATTGKWQPFNQQDTVFKDALDDGYSTAIAGWYNPYCRIMPHVLDQCFWIYHNHATNGMISSEKTAPNVMNALVFLPCAVLTAAPPSLWRRFPRCFKLYFHFELPPVSHIQDYEDLYTASQKLLRDRSAGFILLHLPLPHPGGIYNRATGKLTTGPSTYIDNLALTDKCLAGLRATLEQTGQWNSSTIVIMGDHGWRTAIWKAASVWSKEAEEASNGGKFDPRPAYIVKLPGQTTAARIDTPFHAVETRKLFDQLLTHAITTPAELSAWARSVQ